MTQTRRNFLRTVAALAAASLTRARSSWAATGEGTESAAPLSQFGYGAAELLEGPLRQQFETNHAFYLALDEDSLLKPFRERAGLPAPGEDMGGWYDWTDDVPLKNNHGFAPGHSFGQYLSGLARDYAATGSKPTQEKIQRLVRGYGAAVSPHFNEGHRFPAYTYDKIAIGMLDAHEFAGDTAALKVLDRALDAVLPFLPATALSRAQQYARPHTDDSFCYDEYYTLPENFFLAYKRGAGARYRELGIRFLADDWYFDPLAAGQNVLPGKHAYSHVNALSSAMQAYLVLSSEKHLHAAENGFGFLRDTQSFATGGWGPDEWFRAPGSGEIGASLFKSHSSFETPCGAYAHFKITRYLLRVTRDSRYGDSMEKVLYNTILGAKPIRKDGIGFYYSDYNIDGSKFYRDQKWTCCSGSFAEITAEKPGTFPVLLRIPSWAGSRTRIAVNGTLALSSPEPGKFARLERTWKSGDRIEIEFDMPTVLEAVDPQHPELQAPVHGPLALFSVGAIPAKVSREELLAARQVSAGSTDWEAETAAGRLTLRPFPVIGDEHYRLYLST